MEAVKRIALVVILLLVVSISPIAYGQSARKLPGGPGLMSYAPKNTVFFVERQGHNAIKKAFAASNTGKMAKDDAMNDFIHGTRVRIGEMIVKEMFSLKNPVDIQAHQKTLHELLKPFWYEPSAMVMTLAKGGPEFYFLCRTGQYHKECKRAIEKLMSIGVAPLGNAGKRQAFTHTSSGVAWRGVVQDWREFQLSNDPVKLPGELRGKTVFMAAWSGKTLCIAASLQAADRASVLLAKPDPAKSILANESVARIAAKTHIKDWAFRWHVNLEPVFDLAGDNMSPDSEMGKMLTVLGLDTIRGIGGTGGYLDNVYTRFTYADSPNSGGLFKHGGDYKKALAMTPEGCVVSLAGQFNTSWIGSTISNAMGAGPQIDPPDPKARENPILTQAKALLASSDGNGTLFLTSLQALMGGMMGGRGVPVGFVLDIKDHAKATKAMDVLTKMASDTGGGEGPDPVDPYRKIKIVPLAGPVTAALTKDRLIIAMGKGAMTAAIDTALDDTGGFAKGSQAEKLVKLAGDGAAVFHMDMSQMVKVLWPLLISVSEQVAKQGNRNDFPLVSIPSAGKMARMLGPEIAVFKPDKGGLLLKSRGKIPLITKILTAYPVAGGGMFFLMMR
ncbi:MAG: hypothetical protein QGG42_15810 [Phycisphaerae bacterium]|jgi:hypothetical protein|nr:hypothetical protein [Phycisphaerae bacterium]